MKKEYIPDIILERYLLGEMDKNEKQDFENSLVNDPELKDRLEQALASNNEILNLYKSKGVAQTIHRKMPAAKTPEDLMTTLNSLLFKRPVMALGGTILLATITISFLTRVDGPGNPAQHAEVIYLKGDNARLSLYRQKNKDIEELTHKSVTSENDLVQISYFVKKSSYAIIFSIDGNGVITPHTGALSDNSRFYEGGKTYAVDHSYQLDDAPHFETFFLVYAENPFKTDKAIRQVLASATLSKDGVPQKELTGLAGKLNVTYITLYKKTKKTP